MPSTELKEGSDVSEDMSALDRELSSAVRRVERRVDPGGIAVAVSVFMLVLIASLMLPWTGTAHGWEILSGSRAFGLLPRLFSFTSLGFGLVISGLALASRSWALAWLTAVGCGFAVINGLWAIWSRQTGVFNGGTGPAAGLLVAVIATVALTACWVRVAFRRA